MEGEIHWKSTILTETDTRKGNSTEPAEGVLTDFTFQRAFTTAGRTRVVEQRDLTGDTDPKGSRTAAAARSRPFKALNQLITRRLDAREKREDSIQDYLKTMLAKLQTMDGLNAIEPHKIRAVRAPQRLHYKDGVV
ncbi:hypothetical protein V8E36_007231 [Tilletia maclaganii]